MTVLFRGRDATGAGEGDTGFGHAVVCCKPPMTKSVERSGEKIKGELYLGLSGINRIPMPRISGQMMPMPTTIRHEPDPGASRAAKEIQSRMQFFLNELGCINTNENELYAHATRIPNVMNS